MDSKKLTLNNGAPYYEHQDSQTVGPRGPVLLQDFVLQENLAHFVRERIPERIVHAKGTGAYGTFTVTHDISQYTKAKLFSKIVGFFVLILIFRVFLSILEKLKFVINF